MDERLEELKAGAEAGRAAVDAVRAPSRWTEQERGRRPLFYLEKPHSDIITLSARRARTLQVLVGGPKREIAGRCV